MDSVPVVRRFPLALAKNLQLHRALLLIDLDMDLRAFAIILGFSPSKSRV